MGLRRAPEEPQRRAVDYAKAVLSFGALDLRREAGMGGHACLKPRLRDPDLQAVNREWQCRLLTSENHELLADAGALRPFRMPGATEPDGRQLLVLMCLRLTEHGTRLEYLREAVRVGLLPELYLGMTRDGPVPGVISSCDLHNVGPIVRNFLTRNRDLAVGRSILVFFDTQAFAAHRRVCGRVEDLARELRDLLLPRGFDSELLGHWEKELAWTSTELAENHNFGDLDFPAAMSRGEAFLVPLGNASDWPSYASLARAAANKAVGSAPHATAEFYAAVYATILWNLEPERNPSLHAVCEETRLAIGDILRSTGMFYVEVGAWREADALKQRAAAEVTASPPASSPPTPSTETTSRLRPRASLDGTPVLRLLRLWLLRLLRLLPLWGMKLRRLAPLARNGEPAAPSSA